MFFRISILLALFAGFTLSASAATFYVNTTTDTPDAAPGNGVCATSASYCSLRAAITEANALSSNDTIVLPSGIFTTTLTGTPEENNASGDFDLYGNLTLIGAGSGSTIFQAATSAGVATQRVIDIRPGAVVTVNGVAVRYGLSGPTYPYWGGGIISRGNLTLNSCVVSYNEARISSNATDIAEGGGIYSNGSLTLNSTTVMNNIVRRVGATAGYTDGGGGINAYGTVKIYSSNILNNQITSSMTSSSATGAGLALRGQFTAVINGSNFTNNTSSTLYANVGGGISAWTSGTSTLNIVNSSVVQNGIASGTNNDGGGIHLFTSSGGLTVTINRTTISGNYVYGSTARGGGIYAGAYEGPINLTMVNSTASGNYSVGNGGGVYLTALGTSSTASGVTTITNSTISDNAANQNGGGIASVQENYAATFQTTLDFSTVAGNYGNYDNAGYEGGGGVYSNSYGFILKNSVIGRNVSYGAGYGPDYFGYFISNSYNHIENPSGGTLLFSNATDKTGNPQLAGLGNYGGPTLTRHPYTGSPLIGQIPYGVNGCGTAVSLDQRGAARPDVGYLYCDKGAVEVIGPN